MVVYYVSDHCYKYWSGHLCNAICCLQYKLIKERVNCCYQRIWWLLYLALFCFHRFKQLLLHVSEYTLVCYQYDPLLRSSVFSERPFCYSTILSLSWLLFRSSNERLHVSSCLLLGYSVFQRNALLLLLCFYFPIIVTFSYRFCARAQKRLDRLKINSDPIDNNMNNIEFF